MNYTTKFEMGQEVWIVSNKEHYRIIRCELCDSTGQYEIKGEVFICPKCEGRSSKRVYAGRKYYVMESGKIGKITIEHQVGGYLRDAEPNPSVRYMIDTTGIGSGSVYWEHKMYASKVEAQTFCDRMNGVLLEDEQVGDVHPMTEAPVRF